MWGCILEAVESARRWAQWSVKGSSDVLTRVLDHLDAKLPDGWRRLREEEVRAYQPPAPTAPAWYSLASPPAPVGVTLVVQRLRDSELRGGRVWFPAPSCPTPAVNVSAGWGQVMHFLDNGIVPAAKSAGASVRTPTAADLFLSDLPPDVAEQLREFSHSSRKSLPLQGGELELWRAFVIASFRGRAIIDSRALVDWFVHEGWTREAAIELNQRFVDESLLLTRYADEVSAA
jgi:hypothetical protein